MSSILPGGTMTIRTKIPMTISGATAPRKVIVIGEGEGLRDSESGRVLEMIPVRTGGGRQALHHITVGIFRTPTTIKKGKPDKRVVLSAGNLMTNGTEVTFLVLECSDNVDNTELVATLETEENLRWLQVCNDAVLRRKENNARRLFLDAARVMENGLAEFWGPSSLNLETNPNLLNVARESAENTIIFDKTFTNKMFETYSAQTVKIIITVDTDTLLVIVMTTMRAWKESMLGISEWKVITTVGDCCVSWPEINKFRK